MSYVFLFVLLALWPFPQEASGKTTALGKRNVLLIVVDDGGFETPVYNISASKTPNLDSLAKRSLVVRKAFTSVSSCSPSRSAILSGMPQHQNGMYGLYMGKNHFSTYDGVKTLPNILKNAGIRTGLIGKKHVGPNDVYSFDFQRYEGNSPIIQVGRNATHIRELARTFITADDTQPFFLYIGFKDVHRCDEGIQKYGQFCERFGNGIGSIPDWSPPVFHPDDVEVPNFLPDTPDTRADLVAQYTAINRMDAGVGALMKVLEATGHLNDTLIIYTADNGIPFPGAKTNLLEPGMAEPMLISSPFDKSRWGQVTDALTSTLDILPTILDWFDVKYPKPSVTLTGKSMLPLLKREPKHDDETWSFVYASHNLHEVTMYYPMRVVRDRNYRLVHNLNYFAPYPIAGDIFSSPTFQEILNRTRSGQPTKWFKKLHNYYYRAEWELYDVVKDPMELNNLFSDHAYANISQNLMNRLQEWQTTTIDHWLCQPEGIQVGNKCGNLDNLPDGRETVNS